MSIANFLLRVNKLVLNPIILLMFGLAFLYFFYGIVNFLRLEAGDKSRKEAQDAILWGIVGMVIMFSVYGLIKFVMGTFGLTPADITSPDAQNILKLR